MIRHTVTFKLKHQTGSIAESKFLEAAKELASLPTAKKFECLKVMGNKNNYDFALSMEFDNMSAYDAYNNHQDHVNFVQERWIPEVIDYIEIDYQL